MRRGKKTKEGSDLSFTATTGSDGRLESLQIVLSGEVARIPSLKNSKIPGKNFTNPKTTLRIKDLDSLWFVRGGGRVGRFGDLPVFVLILNARRPRRYDSIGVAETISDWLEPSSKRVGKGRFRGWGVGLIDDDDQVTSLSIKAEEIFIPAVDANKTYIFVWAKERNKTTEDFLQWGDRKIKEALSALR